MAGPTERCCPPGQCHFRVANVERFVRDVRRLRALGLDVSANARSVQRPARGFEGADVRTPCQDYDEAGPALVFAEVQRAMREASGSRDQALALCRYALDGAPSQAEAPTPPPDVEWIDTPEAMRRVGYRPTEFYRALTRVTVRRRHVPTTSPHGGYHRVLFAAGDIERLRAVVRGTVDTGAFEGVGLVRETAP